MGGSANLGAFRTFVRFVLVWICWFPLPLGVGVGGGGTPWTFLLPFFVAYRCYVIIISCKQLCDCNKTGAACVILV